MNIINNFERKYWYKGPKLKETLNWIVLILDIINLPETTGYYIGCFITF